MKANRILIVTIIGLFLSLNFLVFIEAKKSMNYDNDLIYTPNLLPVGAEAIDFTLTDIVSDASITFSNFEGKVIILNFFTTYGEGDLIVTDELKEVKSMYSSSKLAIMSVAVDPINDNEDVLKNFTEFFSIDWYVFMNIGDVLINYYDILGTPTIYFITPEQTVHYRINYFIDSNFMSGKIDEILPDDPPTSNPNGGLNDFWQNNWLWFTLGGIGFLILTGFLVYRRRIVVHNKKVRKEKLERKQQKARLRNR
ncbi:MAG: redoxin domain-containing protein [Asgard group archaeon]|nr:redoxin domain-containing protein [Asgard group archaeon]